MVVHQITVNQWDIEVLQSTIPVLVYFRAEKYDNAENSQKLEELSNEHNIKVVSINAENNEELYTGYRIKTKRGIFRNS